MSEWTPPPGAKLVEENTETLTNEVLNFTLPEGAELVAEGEDIIIGDEQEKLTEEDWNLSEEDFKADKSGKLARLYPEFDFQESGIDDQITVTNKRTGKSDYFDLGSSKFRSDFDDFNEWIANERANMPELNEDQERIYNRTGLIKDPAVTGFLGGEIQPAGYGDIQVRYSPNSNASRDANEKELSEVMDVLDSLQQDAFFNPYKYDIGLKDSPGILKLDYENDQHRKVKDKIINTVKETTGVDITNDSFNFLYNKLAAENKTKVDREYEKRKVNIEGELNPVFEIEFGEEADEGKEEYQLNIEGFNAQQFEITQELSEINNKIKQANNNTEIDEKQLAAQISSLKKRENDLNNLYNRFEELKKEEAKKIPGYAGTGRLYTGISNKELTTSFFNNKGYSKESVNKLAELAEDTDNSAAAAAQTIINQNPGISQREAVKELYDNELLYLQDFQKEGREKFVTLDISEAKKGGFKEGLLADAWQIIKKYPSKYEDLGNDKIKISYEALREMGVDSRKFEGWYDSMIGMADEQTIESIKAYNQEIDESTTIARSYRNLWRNNVDVGAIEKPGFFRNLFQDAGASIVTWGGLNEKEAKEFLGGTKDGFQRDRIDNLNNAIAIANSSPEITKTMGGKIELTEEQKENIDKTMSEEISSGVGYFIPDLMVLGFTGGTMNALGYAKLMERLSPLMRFAVGATVEEAKMQTILDMKPGGGAAFYTLGQATSGLTLFKKRLKWLEPLFQKVIKQGPIGATSAEFAQVSELAYESLMGDKNFKEEFDKLYGDFDEVIRRFIVNNVVFSMTGAFHIAEGDFTTTRGKYRAIAKLQEKRDALMQMPKDLQPAVDRAEGVSIPDAAKPKKTYDDLTSLEKAKFNEYNERILRLTQQVQLETMNIKLNPNSKNFEKDFDRMVTQPMNKAIQSVVPEFEGVKVVFGSGKEFRRKNFDTNSEGKDLGNTAEYNPKTKEMYFDLDFYTAGKPVHEFTHAAINSYFDANPNAKRNFTKRMGTIFKDFDFGQYEGTELEAKIKEAYNIDLRTWKGRNLAAEEYLAFMSEFLADPKIYYTNTNLASNFMKEFRLEVKDIMIESGLKTPTPKTAKDMVQLMALLGKSTRMGTKLDVKASQLAKLDEIDILGTEIIEGNRKAQAEKTRASLDLEGPVVKKSTPEILKENKELREEIRQNKDNLPTLEQRDRIVENNMGLVIDALNKYERSTGFKLSNDVKTEAVFEMRMKLFDYASRYDASKNDVGAYLNLGFVKQVPNTLRQIGAFEQKVEVENFEDFFDKNLNFGEGASETTRTDAQGRQLEKALVEPISIVKDKTKQESTEKSISDRLVDVPESYKDTPDLSNISSEFGVRDNRINNENGTIRVGSFKFKDSEFKSAQDKFSEPGFLEQWYNIAIPEGQVGAGAREGLRGTDTGLQQSLKNIVYKKTGAREKTGPGKETQIKKPFSEVEADLQKLLGIEPGKDRVQNSKVNTALKNSIHQLGKAITNRTIRKSADLTPNQIENLRSGKSEVLASRFLSTKTKYSEKQIADAYDLLVEGKIKEYNTKYPGIDKALDPVLLSIARGKVKRLKEGGNPTFKKLTKKDNLNLPKGVKIENIIDGTTGKGMRSEQGDVSLYDMVRIEEYLNQAKSFASSLPKEIVALLKDKSTFMQSFGLTARTTGQGVLGTGNKIDVDRGTEIKFNDLTKNQYEKIVESLGSNYKSKIFDNISSRVFKGEKQQKDALKKFYETKDLEKLSESINLLDNQVKQDIYFAMESAKEAWLWESKDNPREFEAKARFLYQMAAHNSGTIKGYSRQFVPIEAAYMPEGVSKKIIEVLKLEHLKSSLQQSMEVTNAVIEGRFRNEGRGIMKNYSGIISFKKLLDIVDNFGGTTNTAGLSRMAADLQNLKNYKTVESDFKENLYDKLLVETAQQLGAESRELKTNYLRDELAKFVFEPTPENRIILETAIKNKFEKQKVFNDNIKSFNEYDVLASKDLSFSQNLENAKNRDKANEEARKKGRTAKKIRVFDFDDTLARSNNIVTARKDGKEIKLNAEDFAKRGLLLKEQGWEMDFSDFNKVTEGSRGPLFKVAERIRDARGNEDLFVLTARAPESRDAIYDFLKAEGLEFKRENIIGLGNSTGEAKANWLTEKAAEGYNDFYFADDAPQNVKAVRDALSVYDIKSKVQQAYASKDLSKDFNNIIEQTTGVEAYKEYSAAKAKVIGANKGKFKFWIPYSAEDFQGLIYKTLSKGKLGDQQMAWYKGNVLNPYARAMDNLSRDRVQLMSDFKALKKQLDVPKDLRKQNDSGFTNEQAVRVYLYNKMGHEVPGLSKTDLRELTDIVNSDGKLKAFADQILTVTKGDGYVKPGENWLVGTITTDLIDLLNTTKRKKYLQEWQTNVDQIYSKENLNKLEAVYGPKYREALENSLLRMKSGKNRLMTGSRLSNQMLDYINGSNAAIMFFNTRSAILQTISAANFINWSFNNPYQAGKAFANQKQYWKDFTKLMNSNYLLDRRNGLKLNIAESEIADAAATSKNKVKGAIKYILQKGYLPTQYADSFAIASGGATWYRNRINDLVKKGVKLNEAEQQAIREWRQIAEESQQSSDPSKISQQQASDAGRLILMFANTPMQYARLTKRAYQDLVNRRGDAKSNVSKIIYYTFVQNMIFNALQQAMFKLGFDDEADDEEKNKTYFRTANGMLDSQLRGLGIAGATASVAKNFLLDIYERSGRKRPEYVDSIYKLLQFSPPIGSKISRLRQAAYAFDSKKRRQEIFDKGFSLDNPALMAGAKTISATANVPLDRVLQKYYNLEASMSDEADWWQTLFMIGGWPEWSIMDDKKSTTIKTSTKTRRRSKSRRKAR